MASFDELMGSESYRRLFGQIAKRGTFRVEQDSSGRHGVNFMGQFYTSPRELTIAREALKFREEQLITGSPLESLPPNSGYWNYGKLEAAVQKIRGLPGYEDFTMRRVSMGSDFDINAMKRLRVRNGVEHGIMVGDDETTSLFRAFVGGKELSGRAFRDLLSSTGGMTIQNLLDETDPVKRTQGFRKLQKRMKFLGNKEQYSADLNRPTKAFVWQWEKDADIYASMHPTGAKQIEQIISEEIQAKGLNRAVPAHASAIQGITKDAWEKVTSGMSFVSPHLMKEVHSKMQLRLENLEREIATTSGMTAGERRQLEQSIRSMKSDMHDLDRMISKGGRLEGFRLSNLSESFLTEMGMTPKRAAKVSQSMIKGDAFVIAMKDFNPFLERLSKHANLTDQQRKLLASGVDVITSETSIAKEAASNLGISFKPTHIRPGVRTDPQLLTYSRPLFGAGGDDPFGKLVDRNVANYEATLKSIMEGGDLQPAYRKHLENIIGLGPEDSGDMMAILGTRDLKELSNQQGRARRILAGHELGLNPATDRSMFQDVASSLRDFLSRSTVGAKSTDLYGFAEASIQGHIATDFFAKLAGFGEGNLALGSFGVHESMGMIYNSADFVRAGAVAHGGADLDDLLGSMLFWDDQQKSFYGVLKRSPMGLGEIAGMKLDPRSVQGYARILTSDELAIQQNPALRAALEAEGFYEKDWNILDPSNQSKVMGILKQHVPTITDAQKADLQRLGYMQTEKGLTRPVLPDSLDVLTRENYEAEIQAARAKLNYLNLPEAKTIDDVYSKAEQIALGIDEVSKAEWERALAAGSSRGMLGKYSLVREMADELALNMEYLGAKHASGGIKPFAMEPIIDLVTQASAKGYEMLKMGDVEVAAQSMLRSITEAAVKAKTEQSMGILDPARFDIGSGRNAYSRESIQKHLTAMGSEYRIEDLFMSRTNKQAVYSQSKKAAQMQQDLLANVAERLMADIPEDQVLGRVFFNNKAIADADLMKRAFDMAHDQAPQLSGLPSEMAQLEEFGASYIDTTSDEFRKGFATDEARRVFASFFDEDGTMGKRATEAMGAFVQRYGTTRAGSISRAALADAYVKASSTYAASGYGARGMSDEVLANHRLAAQQTITRKDVLGDLSPDFSIPGIHSAKAKSVAYDTAKMVKDGLLARGPQNMKAGEAVAKLWGIPTFRNATIGGAALVGASLLYRHTRDRTVDDMAGPPLLPGGSFYEDSQSQPMPPMADSPPPSSEGGVIYKVNAQGSFAPQAFKAAAEGLVGLSATGAVFKSLGRSRPNRDPRKSF